jgi:hypothetical protein
MTLSVINFQTVTPTRVFDEANNIRTPLAPIDVHVYLDAPQRVDERGKRWIQHGRIRVREGADLQDGDEVPLAEGTFGVIGGMQMSRGNAITGTDFGWVRYAISKGG